MAVIKLGLLGNFSGKIGSVQGASWKGTPYMQGRITSNGHSMTNKAIKQRKSFASCRFMLSILKSQWMPWVITLKDKKLPAWQLWIKQVADSFLPVELWYSHPPLIANGKMIVSPSLSLISCRLDSGYLVIQMNNSTPCQIANCTLIYCIWSTQKKEFVQLISGANPYVSDVTSYGIYHEDFGTHFIVFGVYVSNEQNGYCSKSSALSCHLG